MQNKRNNLFSDLMYDSEDEYTPHYKFSSSLEVSPVAKLIYYRFGPHYQGKLTCYELNEIKEKMLKAKAELNEKENMNDKIWHCEDVIRNLEKECESNPLCKQNLKVHLEVCNSKYSKCTRHFVSYDCQFKENGRCEHYYDIDEETEKKERYQSIISDLHERVGELEMKYERELARKENRLQEYYDMVDSDYDDWAFHEGIRLRNAKMDDDDW